MVKQEVTNTAPDSSEPSCEVWAGYVWPHRVFGPAKTGSMILIYAGGVVGAGDQWLINGVHICG